MEAMTDWKKYVHLFTNGEFKVKISSMNNEAYELTVHRLSEIIKYDKLSDCQLIARPIADLSDEEMDEIWRLFDFEGTWQEHRQEKEEHFSVIGGHSEPGFHMSTRIEEMEDILSNHTPATLLALSWGVYPFPQGHFGDTVIDINNVEQP